MPCPSITPSSEIAQAIKQAVEVPVVGPGLEKRERMKHPIQHHQDAEKVMGVETVDHPSEGRLLAHARKYFHRIDRMR